MINRFKAKKELLQWLVDNLTFTNTAEENLVHFILSNRVIIQNTSFVKQADQTPRGLVLQKEEEGYAFSLFIQGHRFTDPTQIFHELNMNSDLKLFVSLDLEEFLPSHLAVLAFERNPFLTYEENVGNEVRDAVDEALTNLYYEAWEAVLLKQVDEALTEDNQATFADLSRDYNILLKMKKFNQDEDDYGTFNNG